MINSLLDKLKLDGNNISILLEIVKYYRANNQPLQAEQLINKYSVLLQNSNELKFELANVYIAVEKINEAIDIFDNLIKNGSTNNIIDIAIELSKLYKRQKNYRKAIESIDLAISKNPENSKFYIEKMILQRYLPDGDAAIETLRKVKSLDKEKDVEVFINNIENVEKTRQKIAPYRAFFTWGMHYKCNYNCAYCYAPKPQDITFANNPNNIAKYESLDTVVDSWKFIFDKYGMSRIRLDGGEPSIYPDFYKIIKELSKIHKLHLNTNLSFDLDEFCDNTDFKSMRIDASLHCEYTDLGNFIKKLEFLQKRNYKLTVSYVAYPDFLENIPLAKKNIEKMGIPFFIHPYSGFYNGMQYPASYTESDKNFIYDIDLKSEVELVWRKEKKANYKRKTETKDQKKLSNEEIEQIEQIKKQHQLDNEKNNKFKICEMGRMYARIYPNGNTYRCCSSDGNTYLGNLFDKSVKLLEKAEKCYDIDNCRCWRCMVPNEEDRWLHTWMDDWETEI
ncbi:MAG: radical SAM protein [Endomicrobiaceae bacterium]|nr:radical SAM protein [Endomicrobiaceae bacterium]